MRLAHTHSSSTGVQLSTPCCFWPGQRCEVSAEKSACGRVCTPFSLNFGFFALTIDVCFSTDTYGMCLEEQRYTWALGLEYQEEGQCMDFTYKFNVKKENKQSKGQLYKSVKEPERPGGPRLFSFLGGVMVGQGSLYKKAVYVQ